jgi:hypothetical protein
MTKNEFKNLKRGDIVTDIRHESYVVIEPRAGRFAAIREVEISDPASWSIVRKSNPVKTRSDKGRRHRVAGVRQEDVDAAEN